jgi:hypothetical protein
LAFVGRRCRLTVQRERLGSIARSPICRGRPAAFRCSDDVESRKAPPCSAAISAAQIRAHVVTFGKRPWSPLVVAFSVSVNGASSGVGSRAVEIAIVIVFRLVPTTAFHSSVNRGQGIGLRLGPLWPQRFATKRFFPACRLPRAAKSSLPTVLRVAAVASDGGRPVPGLHGHRQGRSGGPCKPKRNIMTMIATARLRRTCAVCRRLERLALHERKVGLETAAAGRHRLPVRRKCGDGLAE